MRDKKQVEHLKLHSLVDKDTYLDLELKRIKKNKNKPMAEVFIDKLKHQDLCCYYCNTDIRTIQSLIMNNVIDCRKRGEKGYSGLHFEIEHLDPENSNNDSTNLAAACYYCNNDKSNTIDFEIYKKQFGPLRNNAFKNLLKVYKLKPETNYYHKNIKS